MNFLGNATFHWKFPRKYALQADFLGNFLGSFLGNG